MKLNLRLMRSYGQERYYPDCDTSRMVCELMERKSLTMQQLVIMAKYGYDIGNIKLEPVHAQIEELKAKILESYK